MTGTDPLSSSVIDVIIVSAILVAAIFARLVFDLFLEGRHAADPAPLPPRDARFHAVGDDHAPAPDLRQLLDGDSGVGRRAESAHPPRLACPVCGDRLTYRTLADDLPTYCDTCDAETGVWP